MSTTALPGLESVDQPINETGRLILRLHDDGGNHQEFCHAYLALARVKAVDGERYTVVRSADFPDDDRRYQVMGTILRHRAPLTVRGRLVCNGRKVLPETYVDLWAKAFEQVVPMAGLASLGLRLVAHLVGDLAQLRSRNRTGRSNSVHKTFDAFEAAYASQMRSLPDGSCEFTLDMAEGDNALCVRDFRHFLDYGNPNIVKCWFELIELASRPAGNPQPAPELRQAACQPDSPVCAELVGI